MSASIQKTIEFYPFPIDYLDDTAYSEWMEVLSGWEEGYARGFARSMMDDLHGQFKDSRCDGGFIAVDSMSDLIGCVSYQITAQYIHVSFIASKESGKGYGTRMMYEICKLAISRNKGVDLTSIESSRGFYQKIGMSEVDGHHSWFIFDREASNDFMRRVEYEYQECCGSLWMLDR